MDPIDNLDCCCCWLKVTIANNLKTVIRILALPLFWLKVDWWLYLKIVLKHCDGDGDGYLWACLELQSVQDDVRRLVPVATIIS